MKRSDFIVFIIIVCFFIAGNLFAGEKVVEGKQGMYWQKLDAAYTSHLAYQVDTKAQLCFAMSWAGAGRGITNISCEKLAKRPEWKKIITWVNKEDDKLEKQGE